MMETVLIHGIGSEMQGVGRLADGRAVFVPHALPGERVNIEITRDGGRFCEASLVDVLEPSPDRRAPFCPHAGVCGGCTARHMRYERTLELKRQMVFDQLQRIGGVPQPEVRPVAGCVDPERTRNKAEYPIARRDGHIVIGAFARGSRAVVPLEDCLLQKPESIAALRWFGKHLDGLVGADRLRFLITRVNRRGAMMLALSGDVPLPAGLAALWPKLREALPSLESFYYCRLNPRPAHALDGRCALVGGRATLEDELLGLRFELSPQAFFQVNPPQAERLYELALEAAGIREGCGLNVLDAYCGAGTITLAAARYAGRAVGVEIVAPAIENARRNAEANGMADRVRFICADAAREIPRLLRRGERFDAVVLDPPRKGADEALLNAVAEARIPVVSYVSCNPSTLARDVRRLTATGYRFQYAAPVDMFPWTGHVETVALMSLK